MTSSPETPFLSELEHYDAPLSVALRSYFQSRLRNRLYDFIVGKFIAASDDRGLTRAALARRIGRKPEVITRLLSSPGNWTLETISDLLLGISGEELDIAASSPATRSEQSASERELAQMARIAKAFKIRYLNEAGESRNRIEENLSSLMMIAAHKKYVEGPSNDYQKMIPKQDVSRNAA